MPKQVNADCVRTALALSDLYPALHFVVQKPDGDAGETHNNPRVTVQSRAVGSPQTVSDAAVYLLRLSPPIGAITGSVPATIKAELQAHASVLRNSNAMLVLIAHLSNHHGTLSSGIGPGARVRDLSMLQLTNESETVAMHDLAEIVKSIGNEAGRLSIVSKFQSWQSGMIAVGIRFHPFSSG